MGAMTHRVRSRGWNVLSTSPQEIRRPTYQESHRMAGRTLKSIARICLSAGSREWQVVLPNVPLDDRSIAIECLTVCPTDS